MLDKFVKEYDKKCDYFFRTFLLVPKTHLFNRSLNDKTTFTP